MQTASGFCLSEYFALLLAEHSYTVALLEAFAAPAEAGGVPRDGNLSGFLFVDGVLLFAPSENVHVRENAEVALASAGLLIAFCIPLRCVEVDEVLRAVVVAIHRLGRDSDDMLR